MLFSPLTVSVCRHTWRASCARERRDEYPRQYSTVPKHCRGLHCWRAIHRGQAQGSGVPRKPAPRTTGLPTLTLLVAFGKRRRPHYGKELLLQRLHSAHLLLARRLVACGKPSQDGQMWPWKCCLENGRMLPLLEGAWHDCSVSKPPDSGTPIRGDASGSAKQEQPGQLSHAAGARPSKRASAREARPLWNRSCRWLGPMELSFQSCAFGCPSLRAARASPLRKLTSCSLQRP